MLKLTKKGDKYWLFEDSEIGLFSPSKFTINLELNEIVIVYENGLKSKRYDVSDCEIYDLGELTPLTTSSGDLFMQKLEELNCPCFQKNENIFNITGGSWSELTDFDALNDATLPLAGTEEIPIVQGGETKKVAVSEFGGGTPSLQAVTDIGAVTTNQLTVEDNIITIYDSTTFDEISVSPTQITNVDANSFSTDIKFATKTQNTDFVFEDEGGTKSIATREWVALNGGSNVVTEINTTGTASSGTAETITYSVLIPANTMSVGVYDAITRVNKTGTSGIVTVNMYVNNTNDLTTPILIGRSISTATARYMPLQKFIDIKVLNGTDLGTEVANNANNATFPNDYIQHGNTAGMSNVAIDWTIDQYLIVTVTNASAGDSSIGTFLTLKK